MKKLMAVLVVSSLWVAGAAYAQNAQFQESATSAAGAGKSGTVSTEQAEHPKTGQPLKPRPSGVVIMMSKHGLQVINPLAPKELGTGKKMVTESYVVNPSPAGIDDPKPYGGINIFGWEF